MDKAIIISVYTCFVKFSAKGKKNRGKTSQIEYFKYEDNQSSLLLTAITKTILVEIITNNK